MNLFLKHLLLVSATAVLATGCVSDGTFFGQSKEQKQKQQLEQRKQQIAVINRDNRITELENAVSMLRSEYDSISSAIAMQNQRIAELESSIARESNTHSSDMVATSRELEAIRATQKQLSNSVDAIPQNISKLLGEQEKQIMSQVDKKIASIKSSRSTSSSTARVNYDGPCYEHVVEAGQTISEIAQAYKVSQREIMDVNNIKDASRIRVGQKLYIPKH